MFRLPEFRVVAENFLRAHGAEQRENALQVLNLPTGTGKQLPIGRLICMASAVTSPGPPGGNNNEMGGSQVVLPLSGLGPGGRAKLIWRGDHVS